MDMINVKGRINFDPSNMTTKHNAQSNWKKLAIIKLDDDICEYYAWFIKRRYGIVLNVPIRKGHISFINDHIGSICHGLSCKNKEAEAKWIKFKNKYNHTEIDISLDVNVKSNGTHWWLPIPEEDRIKLHDLRKEIGLGRPYWGLHMSIGYANSKYEEHSKYIHKIVTKYQGSYN